jgi:hypothetical protein
MLHDDAGFVAAKSLIDSLPRRSRVGVELDRGALFSGESRKFYSRSARSFSALRVYAEKLGHKVVVLEPAATCYDLESRRRCRRISTLVELSQRFEQGSAEWLKMVGERLRLQNKQARKDAGELPFKSAWRSLLMARKIARQEGWKKSDLIFVGSAHAINLAMIFDCSVGKFIGNYGSIAALRSELRSVMRWQIELDALLQERRVRQRLLYMMRHPINSWNNRVTDRPGERMVPMAEL